MRLVLTPSRIVADEGGTNKQDLGKQAKKAR